MTKLDGDILFLASRHPFRSGYFITNVRDEQDNQMGSLLVVSKTLLNAWMVMKYITLDLLVGKSDRGPMSL